MSERKVDELTEKAKQVLSLVKELKDLAYSNDFRISLDEDGDSIEIGDWLSSDCYGEGNDETFTVNNDGSVWHSSSC